MGDVLQVLLAGLSAGAVIGLVAMGFTLVAGTVRILHLAHGDIVIASVFTAVLVVVGRTPVATSPGPARAAELVVLVLLVGAALGVLVHLALVRRRDPLDWVAGGIAAGLLLRASLGAVFPQEAYALPDPLHLDSLTSTGVLSFGGTTVPVRTVAALVIALVLGGLAQLLLTRSGVGLALRAVADDPEAAALCGLPVGRLVLIAFAAAGLLAGLAGLLSAPEAATSVDDGVVLGLEAVAAAMLGRLGSLRGALLGGLAVGVVQAVAVRVGGAPLQDVAPLALLVVLLAARPRGLFAT